MTEHEMWKTIVQNRVDQKRVGNLLGILMRLGVLDNVSSKVMWQFR